MTAGRYANSRRAVTTLPDGADGFRDVPYLRSRLLPPPDSGRLLAEHTVTRGDRPDLVAAAYLGDPEQFWRLCDANPLLHPDELTGEDAIGTRIAIPLPTGAARW
ncbi:LysM domain-containing protein [Cryptosporangium sp. NPDC048952]|uniref:LysM domain-containing protein n=1 Tax=Cryptosporangium sp. NPDC048952 TaxID=3363961 RepID=UPI00371BCB7C